MKYTSLLLLLLLIYQCAPNRETKPNIIILFCDDMGYGDLGVYGHPTINTPNLDRLTTKGMKFTNFYSGSPACTASRYALLTGRYPIRSGFPWVLMPLSSRGIHPKEYTISEGLKSEGYATACYGKWHLGTAKAEYSPLSNGFDEYLGLPYSNDMIPPIHQDIALLEGRDTVEMNPDQTKLTYAYTDRAIQFIKKNKDNPFFIYLPYAMPHVPLYPGDAFKDRSTRGLYGDVIEEIDWSAGAIYEALKDEGLIENTILLFTSDNGPWLKKKELAGSSGLLKDGKGSTWEGGMRVPAIAVWEGKIEANSVCQTPVSVIDMQRTFFKLAGHTAPNDNRVDGQDVSNVFLGEPNHFDERTLFYYGAGRNILMAVRKGSWKLHIKTSSQLGLKYFDKEMPLLFNLNIDPSEDYELSEQHPEIVKELLDLIEAQKKKIESEPNFFDLELETSQQEHLGFEKEVVLKNTPSENYGTAKALADGLFKQAEDYHSLPGFHGTDMDATVDLGILTAVNSIKAGFLEVHNSWIFLPKEIVFYGSENGTDFQEIGKTEIEYPKERRIHQPHVFEQKVGGKNFRWIRVVGKNIGTCPDWHFGKGEPAWIFPDEIIVN